jgi:hypothetical protein
VESTNESHVPALLLLLSVVLEVLHLFLWVRDDCVCTWPPARGTDLSMLVRVLEGLDQAQGLVHRAADGEVVHRDLHRKQ